MRKHLNNPRIILPLALFVVLWVCYSYGLLDQLLPNFSNQPKSLAATQVVIEKEFRSRIEGLDVASYADKGVGLAVSEEAIIPDWAWMVLTAKLSESAFVVVGGLAGARNEALRRAINNIDLSKYQDRKVIVRGCDKASGPEALLLFQSKIQPVAKRIMFGEACSTVPVFKKK